MKRTLATFLRFVLLAALLAGQTGCVDLPNNISVTEVPIPESDGLMPQNLQFSPDYKTLYLNVNETKDLEGYALDNPAEIRAEVSQDVYGFLLHPDKKRPALKEIRHVGSQQIAALGLKHVRKSISTKTGDSYLQTRQRWRLQSIMTRGGAALTCHTTGQ